jgi:hypothetical protein
MAQRHKQHWSNLSMLPLHPLAIAILLHPDTIGTSSVLQASLIALDHSPLSRGALGIVDLVLFLVEPGWESWLVSLFG